MSPTLFVLAFLSTRICQPKPPFQEMAGAFLGRKGAILPGTGAFLGRVGAIVSRMGGIVGRDGAFVSRIAAFPRRDGAVAGRAGIFAARIGVFTSRNGAIAVNIGQWETTLRRFYFKPSPLPDAPTARDTLAATPCSPRHRQRRGLFRRPT